MAQEVKDVIGICLAICLLVTAAAAVVGVVAGISGFNKYVALERYRIERNCGV